MSMGYDVGELLAEIRAKDAEIARLTAYSLSLTASELKLTMSAIRLKLTMGTMSSEAATIFQKLQVSLDHIEKERWTEADFAASLTAEEREIIKARRAAKSNASQ